MSKPGDYAAVRRDIAAQLKKPGYDDGSAGPVFVRLAWFVLHFRLSTRL
jgi:peroxiredoxin